jgi:hypothetical protein
MAARELVSSGLAPRPTLTSYHTIQDDLATVLGQSNGPADAEVARTCLNH